MYLINMNYMKHLFKLFVNTLAFVLVNTFNSNAWYI